MSRQGRRNPAPETRTGQSPGRISPLSTIDGQQSTRPRVRLQLRRSVDRLPARDGPAGRARAARPPAIRRPVGSTQKNRRGLITGRSFRDTRLHNDACRSNRALIRAPSSAFFPFGFKDRETRSKRTALPLRRARPSPRRAFFTSRATFAQGTRSISASFPGRLSRPRHAARSQTRTQMSSVPDNGNNAATVPRGQIVRPGDNDSTTARPHSSGRSSSGGFLSVIAKRAAT